MDIKEIREVATTGTKVYLTTTDRYVLGSTLDIINAYLGARKLREEWENRSWKEREEKNEDGTLVYPAPPYPEVTPEVVNNIEKVAKFCNKFAIKPSESNVFAD